LVALYIDQKRRLIDARSRIGPHTPWARWLSSSRFSNWNDRESNPPHSNGEVSR
jgi:hypothetical protein